MFDTIVDDIASVAVHSGADGDVMADFATAVSDNPHGAAVVHNGGVITYRMLAERIRRTASQYQTHRSVWGATGLVGALVSHTPAVVEHLLGCLQVGAAYCPIDAGLPASRKQALAAVLGLDRFFLVAGDPCEPSGLRVETLDAAAPVAEPSEAPMPSWESSDPAYVLCTSGSTGAPKPVVISRQALTVTVRALRDVFSLSAHDRVLQFASLGWDTCLEEIVPALTAGATLVFDNEAHSGSFPRFVRMLGQREVTVLDLPTAFWHELVLYLHEEHAVLPKSVRLVVIGGERVDPTRLRQWRNLENPRVALLNTYGCTETTMITHAVRLAGPGSAPRAHADGAETPLGRPLPHVRDHITDDGELLVSGPGLATGYLGLQELTDAGFPVADYGAGLTRWFRTGDLVTSGEAGLLYPRGRTDEQVKVLGVRVHPAEVEAQLNTHPAVAGAVVMGERRLGQTSLTAYVVSRVDITSKELKRYLGERLPSQFVPSQVEFVAALSHTATGKIDRVATQRAAAVNDSKGANE